MRSLTCSVPCAFSSSTERPKVTGPRRQGDMSIPITLPATSEDFIVYQEQLIRRKPTAAEREAANQWLGIFNNVRTGSLDCTNQRLQKSDRAVNSRRGVVPQRVTMLEIVSEAINWILSLLSMILCPITPRISIPAENSASCCAANPCTIRGTNSPI